MDDFLETFLANFYELAILPINLIFCGVFQCRIVWAIGKWNSKKTFSINFNIML